METQTRTSSVTYTEPASFFASQLSRELLQFQKDRSHCDINITLGSKTFHAHKIVLMARSYYFKSMFSGRFSESEASTIDLTDVFGEGGDLTAVIDYMYSGEINITQETVTCVLEAASLFILEGLRHTCEKFLLLNLSPKNSLKFWLIADRYSLPELFRVSHDVLHTWINFDESIQDEVATSPPAALNRLKEAGMFTNLLTPVSYKLLAAIDKHSHDKHNDESIIPVKQYLQNIVPPDWNVWNVKSHTGSGDAPTLPATEDVLFAIFAHRRTWDDVYALELHAFVPRENAWRQVLSQKFPGHSELEKLDYPLHLLYLDGAEAYFAPQFRLLHYVSEYDIFPIRDPEIFSFIYVYSFRSKTFRTIKAPDTFEEYNFNALFVLRGSIHCIERSCNPTGTSEYDLLKYDSETDDWPVVCELPLVQLEFHLHLSIRVSGDSVYIWTEEQDDYDSRKFRSQWLVVEYQVTDKGEKYSVRSLAPPPPMENKRYTSYTTIGPKTSDGKIPVCSMVYVPTWTKAYKIHFPDEITSFKALVYDCKSNTWFEEEDFPPAYIREVTIPPCDTLLNGSSTVSPTCRAVAFHPFQPKFKEDNTPFAEYKMTSEINVGGGRYFAKTASPYTSHLYLMRPWEKTWVKLTSLPFTTDHFPDMRECEVSMDIVQTWPLSTFTDYSPQVGQSAFLWWILDEEKENEPKEDTDEPVLKFDMTHVLPSMIFVRNLYSKWCELSH